MIDRIIKMPSLNANDDRPVLIKWLLPDHAEVHVGQLVAIVETTKTTLEVECSVDGYLAHVAVAGQAVPVGAPIGVVLADAHEDPHLYLDVASKDAFASGKLWTKKAELIAKKSGLNIAEIANRLGRQVTEADVIGNQAPGSNVDDLVDDRYPSRRIERVLLIGGGGGGGAIVIDAINRCSHQRVIGILDNNVAIHGKRQMGIPILGANDRALALWQEKKFDAAIIVVTANIDDRQALFEELSGQGIPFTNVIDSTVQIRSNVSIGVGNLIMANCFLAACVTIGNNNFMASHVCIEHHSTIGNHCTFGPRSATSGAVTVGNRVKFGMGVLVEPYLSIGDNVLVPSGVVVTAPIPANNIAKIPVAYALKTRT